MIYSRRRPTHWLQDSERCSMRSLMYSMNFSKESIRRNVRLRKRWRKPTSPSSRPSGPWTMSGTHSLLSILYSSRKVGDNVTEASILVSVHVDNVAGVKLPIFKEIHRNVEYGIFLLPFPSGLEEIGLSKGGQQIEKCRKIWQELISAIIKLSSLQVWDGFSCYWIDFFHSSGWSYQGHQSSCECSWQRGSARNQRDHPSHWKWIGWIRAWGNLSVFF